MTDRTLTYRPGSWLGIIGENATVLLPGSEKARAGALWALVDDGAGFDAVLDALLAGGLSALPGFVLLADSADAVRVLVRGEATATFESAAGQVVVAAEPGAMWAERTIAANGFAIALPGETAEGLRLAVTDGLVRLGSLETPSSGALASVVQLAPALTVEPTPEAAPVVASETPLGAAPIPVVAPPVMAPVVPPVVAPVSALPDFLTGPVQDDDAEWDGSVEPEAPASSDGLDEVTQAAPADEADGAAEIGDVDSGDAVDVAELDEDDLPTDIFAAYSGDAVDEVGDALGRGADDGIDRLDGGLEGDLDGDDAVTDEQDAVDAPLDAPVDAPLGAPPAWTPAAPNVPPVGLPPVPPTPPTPPLGLVPGLADAGNPDAELTEALVAPGDLPSVAAAAVAPAPPTIPPAHLTFSHGAEIDVAGLIVIGRKPDAGRFPAEDQPFLVTVPSPHSEISSTHAEVRPGTGEDLGRAVVTDLGSTNGTLVVQPGQRPEELRAGVPTVLASGALIDLGDGLTIRVR